VTRSTFQGLRPVGNGPSCIEPSVAARPKANSCIESLPSITAPASTSFVAIGESSDGTWWASTWEPPVMRTPATAIRSLRAIGTP
jgi:hypothetical protein